MSSTRSGPVEQSLRKTVVRTRPALCRVPAQLVRPSVVARAIHRVMVDSPSGDYGRATKRPKLMLAGHHLVGRPAAGQRLVDITPR